MKEKDLLLQFYEATGNQTESIIYLQKFRAKPPEKFAVLYASTDTISEFLEKLFYDIKFLYKLSLYPILIVHIESLEYIKLFYKNIYNEVKEKTLKEDLSIELITYKKNILPDIQKTLSDSSIPLIIFDKPESTIYEILNEIAQELHTEKIIILDKDGGFRKQTSNEKVSLINLTNEYSTYISKQFLEKEKQEQLEKINILLNHIDNPLTTLAVASPITLFQELFTVKGSGTLIKKGSSIEIYDSIDKIDKLKLMNLLEQSFRKKIKPEFFNDDISCIILETNYKGAAILKRSPFGEYLTKFAVDEIARGEGIGRELWDKMLNIYPSFFWRAKPKNPINKWYAKECTGLFKFNNWTIFWIKIEPSKIESLCNYLLEQPSDFYE